MAIKRKAKVNIFDVGRPKSPRQIREDKKFKTTKVKIAGLRGGLLIRDPQESPEAFAMRVNNEATDVVWRKEQAAKKRKKSPVSFAEGRRLKSLTGPEAGEVVTSIALKTPKSKSIEAQKKTLPPVRFKAVVKNPMPFNLEMAKSGVALQTRGGSQSFFIGFDERLKKPLLVGYRNYNTDKQLQLSSRYADGLYEIGDTNNSDIFMNVETKARWLLLEDSVSNSNSGSFRAYDTEKKALEAKDNDEMCSVFKIKLSIVKQLIPA